MKRPWLSVTLSEVPKRCFEEWKRLLSKHFSESLFSTFAIHNSIKVNCFLLSEDLKKREAFQAQISTLYRKWKNSKEVKQILNICSTTSFSSLDPRVGTEDESSYVIKMLFEGLVRFGKSGKIENGVAERVEISDDGTRYTFFLRECYWSNNEKLTAEDFVYSWKSSLNPNFKAPLAHMFYAIKNAREVNEGKLSPKYLGVKAIDEKTLEVNIVRPDPEFLATCSLAIFLPISKVIDEKYPSWTHGYGKSFICNGPFILEQRDTIHGCCLKKNPRYWDANSVYLEKVNIPTVSEKAAFSLFNDKKVDALFYPFVRIQNQVEISNTELKRIEGGLSTRYFCMDCSKPPFNNSKIRQAISLALSREILAKTVSDWAYPHYSLYPPDISQIQDFPKENLGLAQQFFLEALSKDPLVRETIYNQTIYVWNESKSLAHKLAQQLYQNLGITWNVKGYEMLYDLKNYQPSMYGWINRISDPSYFLKLFEHSDKEINFSKWTHEEIKRYLKILGKTTCLEERKLLHYQAEKLLTEEMPMIPICSFSTYSICHSNLHNVYGCHGQQFNVKNAYK